MAPFGKTKPAFSGRSLALLAIGLCVWLIWPAQTLARALVRFVHALPGVGTVTVDVTSGRAARRVGVVAFAQTTPWHSVRSGAFRWSVVRDHKTLARGITIVGDGAYDIVLLSRQPSGVQLGVYRDRGGRAGTSLVRVIHAAPQLGSPALRLDSRVFRSSLGFGAATPYLTTRPGVHSLSAVKLGDPTPLVSLPSLRLAPGVSYSAVLVGSAGRRLRWVTVTDRGAPLTRPAAHARSAPKAQPGAGRAGSTVVSPGDSLWAIAARHLGPSASNEAIAREVAAIWQLNSARIGTGDPNLIFPGQRITFPA